MLGVTTLVVLVCEVSGVKSMACPNPWRLINDQASVSNRIYQKMCQQILNMIVHFIQYSFRMTLSEIIIKYLYSLND